MQRAVKTLGLAGAVAGILLWVILVFFNPYGSGQIGAGTLFITFFMLCLPAIVGLLAIVFHKFKLMWVVFVWSLPYGLYLSATPGIYKLYGTVLMLYLVVAVYGVVNKTAGKSI